MATFILQHWKKLTLAVVMMLLTAGLTGAMAKLMEPVIDKVFTARDPAMLWPVASAIFLVFALRGATTYGHSIIMTNVGQHMVSDMQKAMFSHLIHADTAYFNQHQSGQLLSRFISDSGHIRTAVIEGMTGVGKNTFTVIALIGVMFYQDWKLAAVSVFVFPFSALLVGRLGRRLRKMSTSMQVETGEMTSLLNQSLQGSRHVKAYGMEAHEEARIGGAIDLLFRLVNKSYRVSALASPIAEALSGLAIVTIVIYGGHQVINGANTAGKLFSFITAFLLAFEPMKRLAKMNVTLQMGLAAADRMFKMIDIQPSIRDGSATLPTGPATVTFDHVHFRYPDGSEALKGVTFEARAGTTIALVGASGAGKTTILNLIPRFYDVTGGAIRINGQDIRDVTLASLRRNLALVSQDVAIFNDTVRDNIAYGKPPATDAEIVAAAKLAAAHDFIQELPHGYETRVGEHGLMLSGGQRQRISIARAMLKDAPILLLDEATSALDAQSERLVQAALERLQKGRTTVVVAHRLSTIINADIIYVIDDGRIIESGNHATLLSRGGAYTRLYGTLMKESA